MDIKLSATNRVRLSQADCLQLAEVGHVIERFRISEDLELTFELKVDVSACGPRLEANKDFVRIHLNPSCVGELASPLKGTKGVTVGNFSIQVDAWSDERRARIKK